MKRLYVLFLTSLIAVSGYAQKFSFKHERDISVTKIKTVRFSELKQPDARVIHVGTHAPEPWSMATDLKKSLDAQRKRRYAMQHSKYIQSSEDVRPDVAFTFNGLPLGGAGIPNDNNMAISNGGKVISAINSSVTFFEEEGTYIQYYSLESIVDGQLPNLNRTYDPKVAYDPVADRFILVFLQGSTSADTRIIVGFSATNDPQDAWHFYAINGNPYADTQWSDYPIIGLSKDDLFVTVNILRDGESWQEGFTQSVIWQVDKASGFEGKDTIYEDMWHDLKYEGKPLWSICAVQGGSEFSNPNMYFLSVRPDAQSNDSVFLHEITDTRLSGKAAYNLRVMQADKKYGVPPSAFQPDPENVLQTNDTRVLSAIVEDGYIQYVQSTIVPETGSPGIFHGFMDVEKGSVSASYVTSDTMDYAYPSIAYAGNDKFPHASVITFSHSSEMDYPGTSAVFHNRIEDKEALFSPVVMIKEGVLSIDRIFNDSNERWGDYTGIQPKYNEEGVVWMSGSYGMKLGANPRGRNSVWVGKVKANNELGLEPEETKVQLLPNPVVNEAVLQFTSEKDQVLTFNLYATDGKLVRELLKTSVKQGVNEFVFPTTNLMQGYYFIQVLDSKGEKIAEAKILAL